MKKKSKGRPPSGNPPKPAALQVKGDPAWKEWIGGFAAHMGVERSELVARALEVYAAQVGYRPGPKR
jgi:hypothetical protein